MNRQIHMRTPKIKRKPRTPQQMREEAKAFLKLYQQATKGLKGFNPLVCGEAVQFAKDVVELVNYLAPDVNEPSKTK